MNPFRLHGVEFLFFYIAFALVVTLALRALIRAREKIPSLPPPRLDDPYLIAHLRAGPDEALRVATLSLADRNLLAADGGTLQQQDPRGVDLVKREIEKAVLHGYRRPGKADAVLKDRAALQACRHYQELLERHGLVAGAAAFAARAPAVAIALALVLGAAAVKIVLALSQGRHNIGFLIALAAIFGFVNYRIWRSRRTSAGDAALADLAKIGRAHV